MAKTMKMLLGVLLALTGCFAVFGQTVCPEIKLETPRRVLSVGNEETFRANVSGSKNEKLRFTWASINGRVLAPTSGSEIKLVVPREQNGRDVIVFVRIDGLPLGCPNSASEIVGAASLPIGEPVDRFEKLSKPDLLPRIDIYMSEVSNSDATAKGLIDMYFALDESRTQRIARIHEILNAFRFRKFDIGRVEFAFGEVRTGPGFTTLWIVPSGANRRWIIEDRPGAVFVNGAEVMRNPKEALPKRICDCRWN